MLTFKVHAGCGAWGVVAGSLFARSSYVAASYASTDTFEAGLFFGQGARLGLTIIALIIVALWSGSRTLFVYDEN
jgi:ammonia channel protein AmtB